MNCKQGDLAVVVRRVFNNHDGLIGTIVTCRKYIKIGPEDVWIVPPFEFMGNTVVAINDRVLKPIRGEPVPDEVTDTKIADEESMTIPA